MADTLSPQAFVAKWQQATLKERSAAQEHFLDLCALLKHPTPAEADPAGEWFAFEAGASKRGGGQGFADVWKKGFFAWEYKGKHANLDKALDQLLQYRGSLQNPPLLVVSDCDKIVIYPNFINSANVPVTLTLQDLLKPEKLDLLRAAFERPEVFRSTQTPEQVTREAASEFARLAKLLRQYGGEAHQVAHFLIRLLFCLFAEDVRLLPDGLFTKLVQRTHRNPKAFAAQVQQLFVAMKGGGWFGTDEIVHIDGGLFDDDSVLELDSEGMDILARVCALDWSHLEPSILGTLFERGLDPSDRTQLGAHYTSKEDILLVVEPVLMAPLRRRWQEVQAQARELAARRDQAKGPARTRREQELSRLLMDFGAELAAVRVLDSACGSGNFLYVSLRQILDLWKEVSTLSAELGLPLMAPVSGQSPTPAQLYGIEVNPYAHELAQATVWIGYLQWLRDNGFGTPTPPILKRLDNIKLMDAILAYDAEGRPVEPEWPEADVLVGNPPFLGGNKIRQELGDRYVEDLFALYKGRVPAFADLVCYWFERARAQIAAGRLSRAGLLATNSIRDGANRHVLARILEDGGIFMAWSDRPWVLDGAAVRVSMVGFDGGSQTDQTLDGRSVFRINADLTSTVDLTVAKRLPENADICFMGPSAKGPLEVDEGLAREMLVAPRNVNGRPNSDVVRPVANAADLVQRSRWKWTIDFGVMPLEDAMQYELPFEYVKKNVYPIRSQNRRAAYAEKWWQYAEARPGMRRALRGKSRYIATPAVAKHRIFVWMVPEILCNQRNLVFARDDDYFMGVLHARLHELWSLQMGSTLEDRPAYTPTTTFETFPFPWPPGQEPKDDPRVQAIAQAARELVEKRDRWLNPEGASEEALAKRTLTNLYNQRPTWLDMAHRKLDDLVLDAYGWPYTLSNEEILERLLALNLERAKGE